MIAARCTSCGEEPVNCICRCEDCDQVGTACSCGTSGGSAECSTARAALEPFAIESGVPIPPGRGGVQPHRKYPLGELEVDQSFFVPLTDAVASLDSLQSSIMASARRLHPGKRFITRRVTLTGIEHGSREGIRCWRVE